MLIPLADLVSPCCRAERSMSRDSSPATLIGRLAIDGHAGTMPALTRGMLQRQQRNLTVSQRASSGGVAGSSRIQAASARRQTSLRSMAQAARSSHHQRGSLRPPQDNPGEDNDGEDSDESSNHSEPEADSDEESAGHFINAIMSTLADSYPSPAEFARITQDMTGSDQT